MTRTVRRPLARRCRGVCAKQSKTDPVLSGIRRAEARTMEVIEPTCSVPAAGRAPFASTLPATLTCSLLLAQHMLVFWVAYNLLKSEEIAKMTLWVLVAASVSLRVLALLRLVSSFWFEGRLYILGQNPNTMAHHLSLGLVA